MQTLRILSKVKMARYINEDLKFISPQKSQHISPKNYYDQPEPTEDEFMKVHYNRHYTFWEMGHKQYFHDHNPYTHYIQNVYTLNRLPNENYSSLVFENPYTKAFVLALFLALLVMNISVNSKIMIQTNSKSLKSSGLFLEEGS